MTPHIVSASNYELYQNKMTYLMTTLFLCNFAFAARHSLKYFLTATSGLADIPEFVGSATVNDIQVGYCDSNIKTAEPKQDWMKKLIKNDKQHLEWYSHKCLGNQHVFRANIKILQQRLNQTQGPHVLQRMNGCEWDDETGEIKGFNQYGYNGEDFIALDLETLTWVAPKSQAVSTKLIWDTEKARLEHNKNYYIYECPNLLKKYVDYGRRFHQKTKNFSVSLLQRTPSSPVSCHSTGFYSDRAEMFWMKDGEEIHEGVDKGEILPNGDGTFQMTVELNISAIRPEDWKRYDCVFQLSGSKDNITKLSKTLIRTNWVSPSKFPVVPFGIVVGVVGIIGLVIFPAVFFRKKNNNGFQPANGETQRESLTLIQ